MLLILFTRFYTMLLRSSFYDSDTCYILCSVCYTVVFLYNSHFHVLFYTVTIRFFICVCEAFTHFLHGFVAPLWSSGPRDLRWECIWVHDLIDGRLIVQGFHKVWTIFDILLDVFMMCFYNACCKTLMRFYDL